MVGHKLGEFSPTQNNFLAIRQQIKKQLQRWSSASQNLVQCKLQLNLKKEATMQKNKNIVKAINKNVRSSPRKINNLLKEYKR